MTTVLPPLTGPYPVGRADRAWTDPRPVLQVLAPHPEFDADPAAAVAAGMAPDPGWYAAERDRTRDGWAVVQRTGRPAYTVEVAGTSHLSFMDVPFLPLAPGSVAVPMLAGTTIDPARMLRLTTALIVAFLTGADVPAVAAAEPAAALRSGR